LTVTVPAPCLVTVPAPVVMPPVTTMAAVFTVSNVRLYGCERPELNVRVSALL